MEVDQTVERIRHVRHEISKQCEHDPKKIIEYYKKYQQKISNRFKRKSWNMVSRVSSQGK